MSAGETDLAASTLSESEFLTRLTPKLTEPVCVKKPCSFLAQLQNKEKEMKHVVVLILLVVVVVVCRVTTAERWLIVGESLLWLRKK